MKPSLRPLEFFYLALGSAILVNEIARTQTLTWQELAGALFFFGMAAASIADREGSKGPIEFIRAVMDAIRGRNGGSR